MVAIEASWVVVIVLFASNVDVIVFDVVDVVVGEVDVVVLVVLVVVLYHLVVPTH